MFISFIIPTLNNQESLKECLRSLCEQEVGAGEDSFEMIVSMDSRDDQTEEAISLDGNYSNIRFCRAQRPGVNCARNKGLGIAQGDILYFLDDDCLVPDRHWLQRVILQFESAPEAVACGGYYQSKAGMSFLHECRNHLVNTFIQQSKKENSYFAFLVGGNVGYRRDIFDKYGMFDESIVYGSAETEFHYRMLKNQDKLHCCLACDVYHVPRSLSLYQHGKKSFQQGYGFGYIKEKHKETYVKNSAPKRRCWFYAISVTQFKLLWEQLCAMLFLIYIAMCFKIGIVKYLVRR